MEPVTSIIRWLFTYILYPAVVFGVFFYAILFMATLIMKGSVPGRFRRLVGALLPVMLLIFLMASGGNEQASVGGLLAGVPPLIRFGISVAVAALLMEFGRYCRKSDTEIGAVVLEFFLS